MIMDRIADDSGDFIEDGKFIGDVIEVKMSCYGADFPYGDCGRVLMGVSMELTACRKITPFGYR